ncbi:MAG: SemiSWEET family transporter [Candidatus Loosdrechtia sp.]|uniref:SemiSWEET family transporter n=1 Tax=Candidatus Loosdrechtia sp. TaxID=3101272 RepID=UPI003A62AF17|nr:MAG: SemiSWEET family transporter [Candidatus Jettenia sp. AMX2]
MVWFIIGTIAALCSTVGFVPQIIRGIKTKSLSDVSPATITITMAGSSLWLAYGVHLKNPIIILSNIAVVSLATTILFLRFLFKPEAATLKSKILSLSIQYRITLFFIAGILIPIFLLRAIAYPQMQADIQGVLIRNLDRIAYKQAELITNWIHERVNNADVIAKYPVIINYIKGAQGHKEYAEIVQYLETVKKEYGYRGVLVSDDKGFVIIATKGETPVNNILKLKHLRDAIYGEAFVSNIFPSEIPLENEYGEEEPGIPVFFVSIPLKDKKDRLIGSIALRTDALKLNDLVNNFVPGKTGETYLVNQDGYMLTESRFAEHLKGIGWIKRRCALELSMINRETLRLTDGVQQCVSGNNGFDENGYKNYRGITVIGAWRWVSRYNLGVMVEIDKDEGYGVAYNLGNIVIAVVLIIALPFALVACFAGRRLSVPIIELAEVMKKVVSGDLTQRADIQKEDETGELAHSFNTMAKSLGEITKEIAISEEKYREISSSVKEGIYYSEPGIEGIFTFMNQAGAEILGYKSPEDVIGMKAKEIYLDPADRERLCKSLGKNEGTNEFVFLCKRKDGESFYAEFTGSFLKDDKGNTLAVYGVFRDASEKQKAELVIAKSERRYRQFFDFAGEGIFQSEPVPEGVFLWVNQAGAQILGYSSPEDVIGTPVKDRYVNTGEWKELIEQLEKDAEWRDITTHWKKHNNEPFISVMTCLPVRDESGKPVRIDCVFRYCEDVTF